MLRSFIIIFLSHIPFFTFSQQVVIKGDAPFYKGKEIGVYVFDDLISNKEIKKGDALVGADGNFSFTISIPETQKIFLQIDKQRSYLFAEPAKQYSVHFPQPDSINHVNSNIITDVGLYFLDKDSTELNNMIIDFNNRVDAFWMKYYTLFVMGRGRSKLDSFANATMAHYANNPNQYFKKHVQYSLASLTYGVSTGKKNMEQTFFVNKPVLYHNYEYMGLFNAMFKQYIHKAAYDKIGGPLVDAIVNKPSYDEVMEQLLIYNPSLKSDTLRELVLLKSLPDFYYMPDVNRDNAIVILEQLKQKTKSDYHKKIAENIISSFKKLEAGKAAPNFTLKDKNGKVVSLADFKGKYVYLDFWATWCVPCLQEMKVVPELHKAFAGKIVFISISIDEDVERMKKFLEKNPKYEWIFLHMGNTTVKDDYEIRSVPSYFLVGPDGNFVQSPAERPSGTIEEKFIKLTRAPKKNLKIGEK